MAVSKDDLLIKIQADTANATASISALNKSIIDLSSKFDQLNKAALNTEKTVNGFGMTAMYLNQSLELAKKAFETVKKVLDSTVFKFLEGEEHTKRLSNALRLMGSTSVRSTTEHFKNLAEEMTNLTGVQDETVQDMARLGVTMGLNTDQIDRYIRAAADASAATGVDMLTAFNDITASLRGNTRSLAAYIPVIKNFTEEQAKAGKAADYFAERMSGFAEANADSFSVTMKKNAVALEDLQKAIGSVVADIFSIGKGQNVIGEVLTSAKNLVQEYHDELVEIGKSIIDFFERVASLVIAAVSGIVMTITGSLAGLSEAVGFKDFADKMTQKAKESAAIMVEASKDLFSFKASPKTEGKPSEEGPKRKPIASPVDPKITAQAAEYQKALSEIQKKTDELKLSARESGMTQLEILDEQLQMINKVIDAKEKEIQANIEAGKYSKKQGADLIAALEDQRKAAGEDIDSKKEQAPGQEYEQAIIAGKSMTNDITKAFQTGTMGMVTGMLGAVDAFVGAAQAVVDFIPGLLDKIANLFNSLTDLPNKILSSFGKILDSILNLITNFIPNIIKDVPKLVSSFIKFLVVGLPNAISGLIDSLPDLLTGFMDSIPEIVMTFVNGFLTSIPKIVVSLIQFIVFGIPKIIVGFVKAMPAIWKAFINGLVTGFKELGKIFGGTFKPKIEMPKFSGIGDDIKKLTGASSDLFNVKDLTSGILDSAKTQSDQFAQSIKDGMQWAIDQLVKAWRWIYDMLIMPIVNAFKAVFSWFTDGINNIFNGLGKIFSNIVDLIKPVFDLFVNAFKGAVEILKPIGDLFKQAVDTLQSVFSPFIDAINKLMGWSPSGGKGGGSGVISEGAKNVGDVFTGKKKIFSLGGPVYASTGMLMNPVGTDTIPAMLSPGEFVMSAGAVKNLGLDAMRNINAGKSPASSAVYNNEFNIKIDSKGNVDEAFIRNRLMSVIKDELRRSSLDGERLLSTGGVR
jgi:hypothetical protein